MWSSDLSAHLLQGRRNVDETLQQGCYNLLHTRTPASAAVDCGGLC